MQQNIKSNTVAFTFNYLFVLRLKHVWYRMVPVAVVTACFNYQELWASFYDGMETASLNKNVVCYDVMMLSI